MRKKPFESIATLGGLALLLLSAACSGDEANTNGAGGAGGAEPDPAVVDILKSLPVFPDAAAGALVDGKYGYTPGASESGRDLWTGFGVLPGTTVEDVTSFFGKELPEAGWEEEGPPWTDKGEKYGSVSETVIYTFVMEQLRLHIQIPLTFKDEAAAPGQVRHVSLILVPKEVQLHGSPVGTPVSWTPLPTPEQVTPTVTVGPVQPYEPSPGVPPPIEAPQKTPANTVGPG